MKLEETIQQCFNDYPSLFKQRWQVLDQLFCVIGNGYKWSNGQLIGIGNKKNKIKVSLSDEGKAFQDPEKLRIALFQWYQSVYEKPYDKQQYEAMMAIALKTGDQSLVESFENLYGNQDHKIQKKVEEDIIEASHIHFYPLCNYSALFHLPKDIEPDWLEGAKETLILVLEHGFHHPEGELNDYQKSEEAAANKLLLELKEQWGI